MNQTIISKRVQWICNKLFDLYAIKKCIVCGKPTFCWGLCIIHFSNEGLQEQYIKEIKNILSSRLTENELKLIDENILKYVSNLSKINVEIKNDNIFQIIKLKKINFQNNIFNINIVELLKKSNQKNVILVKNILHILKKLSDKNFQIANLNEEFVKSKMENKTFEQIQYKLNNFKNMIIKYHFETISQIVNERIKKDDPEKIPTISPKLLLNFFGNEIINETWKIIYQMMNIPNLVYLDYHVDVTKYIGQFDVFGIVMSKAKILVPFVIMIDDEHDTGNILKTKENIKDLFGNLFNLPTLRIKMGESDNIKIIDGFINDILIKNVPIHSIYNEYHKYGALKKNWIDNANLITLEKKFIMYVNKFVDLVTDTENMTIKKIKNNYPIGNFNIFDINDIDQIDQMILK